MLSTLNSLSVLKDEQKLLQLSNSCETETMEVGKMQSRICVQPSRARAATATSRYLRQQHFFLVPLLILNLDRTLTPSEDLRHKLGIGQKNALSEDLGMSILNS
jgi:hypothetical protein